jgi:uncharacterized RDD family membrane protein YckC
MTVQFTPPLTFRYKSNLKKKIIATLLDYSLFLLPTYIYVMVVGHDNAQGGKTVEGLMVLPIGAFWFIYFVLIEGIFGATLAHQGFYLKVITFERRNVDWTQALKRHLLDFIDIFFWGIPGIISITKTEKHQRLGDLWAKTIVVDTKDPEQYRQIEKSKNKNST